MLIIPVLKNIMIKNEEKKLKNKMSNKLIESTY